MDREDLRQKLKNGPLTRGDVLAILQWQLSLPAEEMDVDLISECDLFLAPDGPRLDPRRADALLASMLARIDGDGGRNRARNVSRARGAHRRPARKALLVALLALALLALAVGGAAYGYRRGVLDFTQGFGFARMVSQPDAEKLVSSGPLAHAELEHVAVDVLEAVYDGTELRIVYGLTSPDGRLRMAEHSDSYVMPGSEEGEIVMCDFVRINGQDSYFYNTWEAPGDVPGQVLYYLQTNLSDWGVDVSGAQELAVSLPIFPGDPKTGVHPTLDFTLPAEVPDGLVRHATLVRADMPGRRVGVEESVFSPLNGYIVLRVDNLTAERFNVDFPHNQCEVRGLDGEVLTDSYLSQTDFFDGYALVHVSITPTEEAWPDELTVALIPADGQPDWTATVRLTERD